MRKYGESKTTRIMMATVPHVTAWAGRTKYQADGFLFDWVYISSTSSRSASAGTWLDYENNFLVLRNENIHRPS